MQEYFLSLMRGERTGLIAAVVRAGLWLVSIPYGWIMGLRNFAYARGWKQSFAASVPVLSVGNLTLGGTGKTPFVEYLAQRLRENDLQVAILSRGYAGEHGRNDEALVLEENCPDVPHLQGRDRVLLAQTAALELESEVLILDDGFQHRRLRRDLDIVLIDATCPWGHGYIFPRGLLRESPRGLRRAHVAVITRSDQSADVANIRRKIETLAPGLAVVETSHAPSLWVNSGGATQAVNAWQGQRLAAFCGLGNPNAFRGTLEKLGHEVVAWRTYPDHHPYTRADIDDLRRWARDLPVGTVVATSQKDLVKIRLERLEGHELWALRIGIQVHAGETEFLELVKKSLNARVNHGRKDHEPASSRL